MQWKLFATLAETADSEVTVPADDVMTLREALEALLAAEPAPELPFDEPPLWLLNPPRPLPLRGDHLVWNDAELEWLPGEQRYSSHWWRPDPPVREYRTVRHPAGFCCRVFRDRRSGQWYLQGIF